MEKLRILSGRLKKAIAILILAIAFLLAGASTTQVTSSTTTAEHGSYCLLGNEPIFFATNTQKTPSIVAFKKFCERNNGELLWKP